MAQKSQPSNGKWVVLAIVAAIAAALLVAVVVGGGDDEGWTWPILADSSSREAAEAYGVSGFPFFVIVGADGTVKARVSGEVEIPALTQIVSDALAD